MSAQFFYRTYSKLSRRSRKIRLTVTPFGFFTIALCLISGLAGINIFTSDLYKLFSITFALLLVSYLSRDRKNACLSGVDLSVFFDRRYNAGNVYNYSITLHNRNKTDVRGIGIIPAAGTDIPSFEDFMKIREPGEERRNIWDRNIYYFRWIWHQFRLNKAEFSAVETGTIKAGSSLRIEGNFKAVKRGKISAGGFYLVKKDIFGIFSSYRFIETRDQFYIYPAPVEIKNDITERIKLYIERIARSQLNVLKKFKAGDFVGLRDYVPGDPIRSIHWKTWARRDKPAVIEKGIETVNEISFLLINMAADPDGLSYFENCVSHLYSMIRKFEAEDFEITLYYFKENGSLMSISADKDSGNFPAIYNTIAEITIFIEDPTPFIKNAGNVIGRANPVVFSPSSASVIEKFCSAGGLILFAPEYDNNKAPRRYGIPVVKTHHYEINLP
jgi:hypothetical protein